MQNNAERNSSINKAYLDLDIISKFEALEEFPNTKPLLLINVQGVVLYSNSSSKSLYGMGEGDDFYSLKSEPSLSKLITNLAKKEITNFNCDLLIQNDNNYFEGYLLNIEKININNEDIFIVYLDSQDNKNRLTKKVNTYNQALESVNVGVLIASEEGNTKYTSTAFEEIFNVKIEELYNKHLTKAFKKYLTEFEFAELESAVELKRNWVKVISDISNEGDVKYKEIRLNITEDNFDNSINFIITANDITKHIQQARLIKKSEQRQKSIINNISDPILILRREKGELIFENANNSFYKEILAKEIASHEESLLELVNPVLHSIIHEAIVNVENSNRFHSPFHYTAPKSGKRFLGKVTFTDDQYDNSRLYIINMMDITEQLEIERKLRDAYKKEISLNKLKSTFLANMSHEIRTPLNAIVGYSDLLEDDVKEMNFESSSKMTEYLREGVNRLVKLVDNIVEVSLLESGNEDFPLDKVNLNQLLANNKNVWIELAALKNISVNFELSSSEIIIEANEEKLERAIKELIDNAIKYNIDSGNIIITTSEDDKETLFQISDTGIGIERESLQKIFQLFEQVEEVGYTRKYEGAGLGLSLANKLVSFMNGKMSIISEPNQGTIISITFPKI